MLRIDIITLFPRMLDGFLTESILGRGIEAGHLAVEVHDLRKWTTDKHRTADDRPFGGGAGMVLKPEPVFAAIEQLQTPGCRRIYLTPDGIPLSPALALDLSRQKHLVFLSGHYEGIDQRFIDAHVDIQISLGDFVMSGGEIAAMAWLDAVARLQPEVLNDSDSHAQDSFSPDLSGLLDCPHFTRPEVWRDQSAPPELLSGHHAHIAQWRRASSLRLTAENRPDLIAQARSAGLLSPQDEYLLAGKK